MTTGEDIVLTIDVGTSGVKTALVSLERGIIGWKFFKTHLLLHPDGGAEQDPAEWWEGIVKNTRYLAKEYPSEAKSINTISCTTQWSGTVPIDHSGKPLMNAIIWMDSRGERYIREVTGGKINIQGYGVFKLIKWITKTGGIPAHSGKDSIAHILFLKNKRPEIYNNTYKFLEPKDFINMKLTGNIYASHDSITLHWLTDNRDINNIRYCERLLKIVGISMDKLPELKSSLDIMGTLRKEAAEELGLKEGIEVIGGSPDVQSACIGSGSIQDYDGHIYIGTSAWISCHVPFKKTDIFHNMASLPSPIPGKYFVANEQETAGACLDFIAKLFLEENQVSNQNTYTRLENMASRAEPGSGKVIFVPWLYGERTPVEDEKLRSCFFNISLSTTKEQLIRAVYEGVAFNIKWLLGYVEKFIKKKFLYLNIVGGGASSDFWCRLFADILDRPVRQIEEPRMVNLRGAAFLGFIAKGKINFEDIPKYVRIKNIFEPEKKSKNIYGEIFSEFLNIYRKNRNIFHRLNR